MVAPVLPPSPSPSCDSLDGIEDLDAYLEAMGPLSRFATPPPRPPDSAIVIAQPSDAKQDTEFFPRQFDNTRAARFFTSRTGATSIWTHGPVLNMLNRASLPPEVLALSYCILTGCYRREINSPLEPSLVQAELRVVSCLALAQAYTSDIPHRTSWWAHHVCGDSITTRQLNDAMLETLAALDWNLHQFTSPPALQHALDLMLNGEISPNSPRDHQTSRRLAISIDGATSAFWERGMLTPECTPPPSAVESTPHRFLPLL